MATTFGYGQVAPADMPRDPIPRRAPAALPLAGFRVDHDVLVARSLTDLIESEIIPRLVVIRPAVEPSRAPAITPGDADAFAALALQLEADALIDRIEGFLARGVAVEALLVDLLAPAARVLGEYWKADRCDFVDVTMGLWRLQEVVHDLAGRGTGRTQGAARDRRALFAAMPGDQHGFGAIVVEEMFARAGWITDRVGEATLSDLYDRLGGEWFDLVGLTVSCDCNTGALPSVIVALRSVSRNPRLVVMVGGRVFVEDPALADTVGADGTAGDARAAIAVAEHLVSVAREGLPGA